MLVMLEILLWFGKIHLFSRMLL